MVLYFRLAPIMLLSTAPNQVYAIQSHAQQSLKHFHNINADYAQCLTILLVQLAQAFCLSQPFVASPLLQITS